MSNETQPRYVRILQSAVESKYGKWSKREIGSIWQADFYDTFVHLDGGIFTIEPEHVQEVYVYDEPMVFLHPTAAKPSTEEIEQAVKELAKCSTAPDKETPDWLESDIRRGMEWMMNRMNGSQPTTKPMRVKVVKCSQPQYWYSDKVGKEYPVIKETGEDYLVEDDMYSGFMGIEKSDCEVVQPDPEKMSDEQSAFLKRIAELENRVAQLEEQRRSDAKQPEPQPETNLDKARRLYPKGTRFRSMGLVEFYRESSGEFMEVPNGIVDSENHHWVFLDGKWAEIVQPNQWRLKVDLPEWRLKKGDKSEAVRADGVAVFDSVTWVPASIMPYIADPVVEDVT